MRILLTGGSGDLGQVLSKELDIRGDIPVRLDVRVPMYNRGVSILGSILDRPLLKRSMEGMDCIVHIAAWHGIHDVTKVKDVYQFWDLNVTGTFYVFEAAVEAGVQRIVHISSESVSDWSGNCPYICKTTWIESTYIASASVYSILEPGSISILRRLGQVVLAGGSTY
jgi:nucleoside-diphosphate-sugar epimerase